MPYIWSGGKQTATRFLINNVLDIDVSTLAELAGAMVIEPSEMNVQINRQLDLFLSKLSANAVPMVIYPGNGANQLNGELPALKEIKQMSVTAKRHWQPGQKPVCEADAFSIPNDITHYLIVDDVISSGGTMCAVRKNIPDHVECWAIAQVSQQLGKTRRKVLHRFDQIIVGAELCGDAVSYVPINSISTLCSNPELAKIYTKRNVSDINQDAFTALLK